MRGGVRIVGMVVLAGFAVAADADCRQCHGANGRPPGAADYSAYYAEPARHHPVGRRQPGADDPRFRPPDTVAEGIPFVDGNRNGSLDADEVRLSDAATVECFSCHREHGAEPSATALPAQLRMSNADSRLCLICHRL